jgi:CheY-like chemotaxis protein
MNNKQLAVSENLRNADKEIKGGKLNEAMCFINQIFDLDKNNIYAKAYKERIISMMESQGTPRKDAERIASEAKFPPKPPEPAAPVQSPAPAPAEQPSPKPAEASGKNPLPVQRPQQKKETPPPAPAEPPRTPKSVPNAHRQIKRTAAADEAYRSLLLEIWKDGSISDEEQQRIDSMRDTFAITPDEHRQIEQQVRFTAYLNAIRNSWKKGITQFEPLRKKFLIQDSDQDLLEPKIMQLVQSLQSNGSVLILDDDEAFLSVMKDILHDKGYYVFTAISGEEALQLLESMTPDIVICDINFQKPHMSGFAFYEKFRSIDKYLTTPFIFLSALDQDVLIRTGKKLGADDYLTKPCDAEMLVATVEGKLRRFRELRRSYE